MNSLILKALENIPEIKPGTDLVDLILHNISNEEIILQNGDIFVIAQKIVSKSEDRYIKLSEVQASSEAKLLATKVNKTAEFIQIILDESNHILSSDNNILITEHKLGFVNINAGIDMSNIRDNKEQVLLLPEDPNKTALGLSKIISNELNLNIDIIISDSMTRP